MLKVVPKEPTKQEHVTGFEPCIEYPLNVSQLTR